MSRLETIVSKITKKTELNKGPMNTKIPNQISRVLKKKCWLIKQKHNCVRLPNNYYNWPLFCVLLTIVNEFPNNVSSIFPRHAKRVVVEQAIKR